MTIQENKISDSELVRLYSKLLDKGKIEEGGAAHKRLEILKKRRDKSLSIPKWRREAK